MITLRVPFTDWVIYIDTIEKHPFFYTNLVYDGIRYISVGLGICVICLSDTYVEW